MKLRVATLGLRNDMNGLILKLLKSRIPVYTLPQNSSEKIVCEG